VADSTAIRDVSKLLTGSLLAKLFGVAALMLFSRVLPRDEMAVFPAYLTLIGIPSLFLSFGAFQTLIRKLPSLVREDFAEARSLAMTTSVVIVAGTILVCLLSLPFSGRIAVYFFRNAGEAWIVRLSLVGCVALTLSKITEFMMWGLGRFGETSLIQIAESIVRPSLTVTLYFAFGLEGIVAGLVAAQIVMAILSLWYVRDMLSGGRPSVYPLRRLFRESFPFYIDNYLWYLKGDGDTLLVAFLGPSVLAEYYIARNLYTNVLIGWYSLDKVVLERLARLGQMSDAFRARAAEIHTRVSETAVPAMMLVIAVAPYGLLVLAGAKYADATWPAVALLVVALIQFVNIAINRAVFVGLPGTYRLSASAVEAAAVLIAAGCLVPTQGIMGVAFARIVGPVAGGVFGYALLRQKFDLSLPWQPTLCALAASAPGTLIILLCAPLAHGAGAAVLDAAAACVFWLTAFALLSYALNRPAFDAAASFLSRRYRAVFSP